MQKKNKNLIIFGTAEIAELAYYYFTLDSSYNVVAFTVDDEYLDSNKLIGIPVIPFSEILDKFPPEENDMHVALSYAKLNQLRQEKYNQAKKSGYKLASYLCTKSVFWDDLEIGDNCFILENQTIQPQVIIGNNVVLWSGNHIGHGSIIRDHVYISSHVVIAGHCDIGQRSFLGVNSTIKDFTNIASDCFISMDASVINDLEDGSVVLGASSNVFKSDDKRARIIKKKYFKF
jgi:sugar O-acyltransferase (sialic acid O-acetyltransferase NeuD family)